MIREDKALEIITTLQQDVCLLYYKSNICSERGGRMEERIHGGIYHDEQVNIPIQLLSVTDRDGRITPLWFRLETEEHEIKKFRVEKIMSG